MHWTYDPSLEATSDLMQGDMLTPNPELRDVLEKAHPHFLQDKFSGFMILTQSCDLARRNADCKSRYINLAVIRPISAVLPSLLDSVCERIDSVSLLKGKAYCQKTRNRASMLVERIVNQNEQALGIFYLHQDADAGIAVPSVAVLPVSIALRADHYDALLSARNARLRDEFRSKLGWLVGNLYSRVATKDWEADTKKRVKEIIDELDDICWIDVDKLTYALKRTGQDKLETIPDLESLLKKNKPPTPLQLSVKQVEMHLEKLIGGDDRQIVNKLCRSLENDPVFKSQLKSK